MLRRRILASAMASVMAIGSVAVVASAEDTAAATTQVKTKADLEAYVKSFDSFRSKEINDYGSKSGENFLDALEYAENVIDSAESTVDDYTVAYQMVAATYGALKIYTAEELSTLVKANKSKYESNNVMNETLGDTIYKNEVGKNQWDNFVTAYEDAEGVLSSKDGRIISDAYETLESAVANLTPMDTVTKAQFRAALKSYEQMKQKVYTYDTWRRGSITSDWMGTTNNWKYQGLNTSFGGLLSVFTRKEDAFYGKYNDLDAQKSVSKTSLSAYVDAYTDVCEANDTMGLWTPDDTSRASKASVKALINQYRGRLAFDYASADAEALVAAVDAATGAKGELKFVDDNATVGAPWTFNVETNSVVDRSSEGSAANKIKIDVDVLESASITVYTAAVKKADGSYEDFAGVSIPVDENGMWTGGAVLTGNTSATGYKFVARGSKIDLTSLIDLTGKVTLNAAATQNLAASSVKVTSSADAVNQIKNADKAIASAAADATEAAKGVSEFVDKIDAKDATYATILPADEAAALDTEAKQNAFMKYAKGYSAAYKTYTEAVEKYTDEIEAATTSAATNAAIKALNAASAEFAKYGLSKEGYWMKGAGDFEWKGWNLANTAETYLTSVNAIVEKAETKAALQSTSAYIAEYTKDRTVDNTAANSYADVADEWVNWGTQIGAYVSLEKSPDLPVYAVNLETAMALAELYIADNRDNIAANTNRIYDLNTTDEIAEGSAKGSAAEWTIVYRYLKYALSDKYDVSVSKYTKADVVELLEKSYDLAEKTGDASVFAANHKTLVAARKSASDWVASANKDKKYKDGNKVNDYTATDIYDELNSAYTKLESDFNVFKYSFDEIYGKLASYAEMIDEGELEANDTLKAAMADTALKLSIVGDLDDDLTAVQAINNEAFTTDRYFNGFNRVYTSTDTDNTYEIVIDGVKVALPKAKSTAASTSHFNLMTAFEALEAEVKKQTTPTTLLGDVNGDGVVNALDASAILKAVVNNTAIDVAVGDYNADGAVNALDASAILKFVVSQA